VLVDLDVGGLERSANTAQLAVSAMILLPIGPAKEFIYVVTSILASKMEKIVYLKYHPTSDAARMHALSKGS
jgi:hypothetical protein